PGAGRLDAFAAVSAVAAPECADASACGDADACTVDGCVSGECVHAPARCDDGDACNGVEQCDRAIGCTPGVAPSCDDGDACTINGCNAPAGCVFTDLPGIDFLACALPAHLGPLLPAAGTTRLARVLSVRLARA